MDRYSWHWTCKTIGCSLHLSDRCRSSRCHHVNGHLNILGTFSRSVIVIAPRRSQGHRAICYLSSIPATPSTTVHPDSPIRLSSMARPVGYSDGLGGANGPSALAPSTSRSGCLSPGPKSFVGLLAPPPPLIAEIVTTKVVSPYCPYWLSVDPIVMILVLTEI